MADQSKAVQRFLDALGDFERAGLALVEVWDDAESGFHADEAAPLPERLAPPLSLDEWLMELSEHYVDTLAPRSPIPLETITEALREHRLREMAVEAAVRATAGLHEEFEEAEAEVMGEALATMPREEFERHAAIYAATFTTYTQNLLREEAKTQ